MDTIQNYFFDVDYIANGARGRNNPRNCLTGGVTGGVTGVVTGTLVSRKIPQVSCGGVLWGFAGCRCGVLWGRVVGVAQTGITPELSSGAVPGLFRGSVPGVCSGLIMSVELGV